VCEFVPASTTLPAEQHLMTLALQKLFLVDAFLEPEKTCAKIEARFTTAAKKTTSLF